MTSNAPEPYRNAADFARLAAAFEAVRSAPPDGRAAAIARVAAEDASLAVAVRALLRQHDDDPEALGAPERAFAAAELDAALRDAGDEPSVPETIGPYRVLGVLGRGGMGAVYLAEHEDPDLRRKVAIKVLRTARHDPDLLRRFRAERRILGALQHPNIAALYDGGATADGVPYVAMEHVDGLDLLGHCDRARLSVDARLELFVKVCGAVAHAHRALVVHRDLKPGNVLVTADGEPKLLDFGIAKLLADDDHAPVTYTGHMLLTPEYGSPEQVRGEPVTTATDVYALGVLLYELLTGQRAQPSASGSLADLLRTVCDRSPPPPSVAVRRAEAAPDGRPEPRTRLARRLDGDLDTIVATAMQKDPQRRYGSAQALAEDVERHLRGLPVAARPDTLAYRTRKFVRRNRLPVAVAALLVAVLLAFVVVTQNHNRVIEEQLATIGAQNRTIRAERDTALTQRAIAERALEFLVSLYDMAAPDPDRAETLRARELLDRGARRVARELADLPAQRAPLQLAMGRAYLSLGLYDDAAPLLSDAEQTFAALAPDGFAHREAQFLFGSLCMHRAEPEPGEQWIRRSLQPVAAGREVPPQLRASRQGALAMWLRDAGRFDEALDLLRDARATPADDPQLLALQRMQIDLVEASLRRDRGELEVARALLLDAIAFAEADEGQDHPRHAGVFRELGQVELALGDFDAARAALARALAIDRRWTGEHHPDVDADLFAAAMVEIDAAEWQEAERLLREILRRDEARFGPEHPQTALTLGQLAMVLGNVGEIDEAERSFTTALQRQRALLPDDHPEIATTLANLGTLYQRTRRPDRAAPLFEEALGIRTRIYPADHPIVLTARQQLAVVALDRGDAAGAEPQFRALLELRRKVRGEHPETAGSLLSLATCLSRQGRHADAIPLFAESTGMFRRTLPTAHPTTARPLIGEALARLALGDTTAAEPLLREAEQLRSAALGAAHHDTLQAGYFLLRALAQGGRDDEARAVGRRLLPLLEQHFAEHRMTAEARQLLTTLPR